MNTSGYDEAPDRCVHPTSIGHIRLANQVLEALGRPRIDVDFQPTPAYLAWARRRRMQDMVTRPPKGLAATVLASVGR